MSKARLKSACYGGQLTADLLDEVYRQSAAIHKAAAWLLNHDAEHAPIDLTLLCTELETRQKLRQILILRSKLAKVYEQGDRNG